MTEHDLATLLRDHLADEPPLALSGADAIRTARRQTARRRRLAVGAGALAVAAVAALGVGVAGSLADPAPSVPVAQEAPASLTEAMEAAATTAFAPYVGELGDPRWSVNTVVGDPVEEGDPGAQHFSLDYRPSGTSQVNLTVGGLADSDWVDYQIAGACDAQEAAGRLVSCTETILADGSVVTESIGAISRIGGDSPTMLTAAEVEDRDPATFAWARVVALDSTENVAVRASEYVRGADAGDADWQVPLVALRDLALDPAWLTADVAHARMPAITAP